MPTPIEQHASATQALEDLALNPRNTLVNLGMRGYDGACSCPVYNYLTRFVPPENPHQEGWVVTRDVATLVNFLATSADEDRVLTRVELPAAVQNFIGAFDAGHYPELKKPEWDEATYTD